MATLEERIIGVLKGAGPLDDDEIAARLGIRRQSVNAVCRRMEQKGLVSRPIGRAGKIINGIAGDPALIQTYSGQDGPKVAGELLTEDEVKRALRDYLEARGYSVKVMWGATRGIDIEAHGAERRLIV